jgi:hypothetical protein
MEAQVLSRKLPNIKEVIQLNEMDLPVMREIHDVLEKHGALKRFGVTLLHEHFDMSDDEVMMEVTNITTREQKLYVVKRSEADKSNSIEASWRLDTGLPVSNCRCDPAGSNHDHFEV